MQGKIKIYNSLTRKIEHFKPIESNKLKMYACGITVYDELHLGHIRQAIIFDVIRNYFEYLGYNVVYVRNYTDIDDKIIKRAIRERKSTSEVSKYYIRESERDLNNLKIKPATHQPKVTDHINDIIKYINILIKKGFAYVNNREVFFEVKKFKNYGKLSKRKIKDLIITEDSPNKKNPEDFNLWKPAKDGEPSWNSPWGKGRPGWHIECSVMANRYLGKTFDIHGGGLDLIFPHHENEIAQSESYNGCTFANYWVHNGLVTINGQKMSKSTGNFITIKEILKDYCPDIIKFAILAQNYGSPINFSDSLLKNASKRVYYFYKTLNDIKLLTNNKKGSSTKNGKNCLPDLINNIEVNFKKEMNNNFNTAKILADLSNSFAKINNFIIKKEVSNSDKILTLKLFISEFKKVMGVFRIFSDDPIKFVEGFKLKFIKRNNLSLNFINKKIRERNLARINKNYTMADKIRSELKRKEISIQDLDDCTTWDIIID